MPQTQFQATGLTDGNSDSIQEATIAIAGVKWVNVNPDNIVVTHEDGFDLSLFEAAVNSVDGGVTLTKV